MELPAHGPSAHQERSQGRPSTAATWKDPGSRLRILMVSASRVCGGLEVYACRLTRGLIERGHCVSFVCRPDSWIDQMMAREGVRRLPFAPRNSADLNSAIRMAAELRRDRFHLIHAHKAKDHIPVLAAGRMAGKAVIFSRHDMMEISAPSMRAASWADRVIAVSEPVRQRQIELGLPADRVTTLLSGVDTDRFRPREGPRRRLLQYGLTDRTPVFALVARIQGGKRVDTYLEAAALVHATNPQARFLVVGDGPEVAVFQALSDSLGLSQTVIFTGHCSDVEALLPELDALVLPSYSEAFGLVVVEAMACGIPVLSTPVQGPRLILEEGKTGLFFPVGDAESLAEAMRSILNDPAHARQMGCAGRLVAIEKFNETRMLDGIEAIYREVLAARA